MMLMPPAGVPASSTFYLLWFFSCCCLTTSASAGAHRRPGGSNRRGTPTRSTTDEAATAAACTSPTKTGGSSIQRVVSFPCGGRGCSSTVPYLVPTSNGAHDATVDVPARKSSGARVTGRRRQRQQSSSSTVVTPDDDDSRNGVLVNRKAYSWVTGGRSGGRRGGGLVGYGPECFVESSGGGLDEKRNGGEAEERTASELDLEEANAEVEQGISSDFSVGRIRGGASGGNVVGSVGTGPDRRFETGTEVASRSPTAGVLLGSLLSRIRGGGPGGHAWFSGYSDTEEEEGEDEEGPDYDTDYDSDSESDDGLTGKEGEGVEAGEGDDSGDGGFF